MIVEDHSDWVSDPQIWMMENKSFDGFFIDFKKENIIIEFHSDKVSQSIDIPMSTFEKIIKKIKEV